MTHYNTNNELLVTTVKVDHGTDVLLQFSSNLGGHTMVKSSKMKYSPSVYTTAARCSVTGQLVLNVFVSCVHNVHNVNIHVSFP